MTMNQDVIIARIIAASKDIFTCEKSIVTLKDIYHSAIRQYLLKNGDPRANCGSLSPEKPEYEGVIKYTKPHYRALMKKKRELYMHIAAAAEQHRHYSNINQRKRTNKDRILQINHI
ncbi:hypothetical protein [Arsenophonus endosymbiont of Crataerina pallida]|uniref:hypothetical protein n=1 Tax=Arsenophonus endosymbiont of Crataerina pallida TaxID=3066235 RepID=UPI0030CD0F02